MDIDIVIVTYNSEKWIEKCFNSIFKSNYDHRKISIFVVDNNSKDCTIKVLESCKEKYNAICKEFVIIKSNANLGFGKGNNIGFEKGMAPYVLFLNIDTELQKNAINSLEKEISKSKDDIGLWELRQFPYEHPKHYDPITLETSWSSGAAFVIKREIFKKLKGFDKNLFMYAEDVDLSWRVRLLGYKLKYVPSAIVYHYCYIHANEVKPTQYYNSIVNNLLLRYKFTGFRTVLLGYKLFFKLFKYPQPIKGAKLKLFKKFILHFFKIWPYVIWNFSNRKKIVEVYPARFYDWDYEIIRKGAFYLNELPKETPKVSIVVRTHSRPDTLRETLISLRNQTYSNIEILVVEDGENTSESMIKDEFQDLNIKYSSTGKKVWRSGVGNIGMEMATGKYINFLDDDDLFFADHIEVLVRQLEINPDYRAAYSIAFETPIKIISKSPYVYTLDGHFIINDQPFNRLLLCHHNYIPIQTIMFDRNIFLEEGGMDESVAPLEDWNLFLRYALKNKFLYVPKVTSIYRVPADRRLIEERILKFDEALIKARKIHAEYVFQITPDEVVDFFNLWTNHLPEKQFHELNHNTEKSYYSEPPSLILKIYRKIPIKLREKIPLHIRERVRDFLLQRGLF